MTDRLLQWFVEPMDAGRRLDVFLADAMGQSRAQAQRRIEAGAARVNGECARANLRLRAGDRVEAEDVPVRPAAVEAERIELSVVFEDEDLLVVDKPRGMVVHPAAGHASGTLVNAVLGHADALSGIGGEERPGIVHRLDKDTTGLLVVAKNDRAHRALQAQIAARTLERSYVALLWGRPKHASMVVDAPIGRHPVDRKRMAVVTDPGKRARPAVTELTVDRLLGPFCRVTARLQTGRTHQIRVHCAYIGHPVVADPVYGGARKLPAEGASPEDRRRIAERIAAMGGQALHAWRLAFTHPRTGERIVREAPLPADFAALLEAAEAAYGGREIGGER
jgi:23S rRNA pseudouridine1911/1915/1917 synthase